MARIGDALSAIRDWLDERGRLAWIAAMVAGFVLVWPVGLGILIYMISSGRFGRGCGGRHHGRHYTPRSSGNSAFDAYRAHTIRRLEDEHAEFTAFMDRLREARDKSEFDEFMAERKAPHSPRPEGQA
ncbi:MAG: DUF2852 domain-containing protein [Paracoccus sp. (in: a-proteobacteria)]|nr:DUF2852 domain-containing protein [Paracoccus sp. (in: a-proteobacteria)]